MTRRFARLLVAALAAVLVAAAPASADDAAVWNAYNARNADVDAAVKQWDRTTRAWVRSKGRRWRPVVRALKTLVTIGNDLEAAVNAQSASSSTGEKAKALLLASIRSGRAAYRLYATATRNAVKGRRVAISQAKRAERLLRRGARYDARAVRAYRALGIAPAA